MNTYIYSLSNPVTGEVRYIGKADNINKRLKSHLQPSNIKRNTYKNKWLRSLLTEGITPHIEIIDIVPLSEWEFWECFWIEQFRVWGFNLVNNSVGGYGGSKGRIISETTRLKMRENRIGKKHSNDTKEKMSKSNKGYKKFEGKQHSEKNKKKLSDINKGKVLSKETKEKISLSNKGLKRSEEFRLKRSEYMKELHKKRKELNLAPINQIKQKQLTKL